MWFKQFLFKIKTSSLVIPTGAIGFYGELRNLVTFMALNIFSFVIPAQTGVYFDFNKLKKIDLRLRGNNGK